MDGREAMALSAGSHPYYIHRGGGVVGSGSQAQTTAVHTPPGFRTSPNPSLAAQQNARPGSSTPAFSIETSNANFRHGVNMTISSGVPVGESVKKKRGRPRKYAPDGQVSLGLSPLPVKPKPSTMQDPMAPKRARGRPPGTGRKQRLADLGEWMNSSAGQAFSPHVIKIEVGEDIVSKIMLFSQQRPRAVCILSGTGSISSVTLRQPASTGPTVTYEVRVDLHNSRRKNYLIIGRWCNDKFSCKFPAGGNETSSGRTKYQTGRFEILCLSGSYLVAEEGGPRNRAGGLSASLSSPDGHVIGGAIGMLIAATPVQVVACSFVYGSSKTKEAKSVGRPKKEPGTQSNDKQSTPKPVSPASVPPVQSYAPTPMSVWPGSRLADVRNPHNDIDLTRG